MRVCSICALVHPPGDDRDFEKVAAVLREDHALARCTDLVTGTTDALQPPGDRCRALDLDDEVDRAHVDAELEAARGDQRGESTGLELLLDLEALFPGDAPVVGADQVLAGELVEALREPLAEAAAVREDDRALVAADQFEDPRVDRRPDARSQVRADRRTAGLLVLRKHLADGRHVIDRDDDFELERFARTRVHDRDVSVRADAAQEARDRVERPLRG